MHKGWIGFDLDGTLAEYNGWKGADHIGAPVPAMVALLKQYLLDDHEVRIFTARVWPLGLVNADQNRWLEASRAHEVIEKWCAGHIGAILPITCTKDYGMILLYDDRCKQVEANTGRVVGE